MTISGAGSTLEVLPGGALSLTNPELMIGNGGTLRFSGGTIFANSIQNDGTIIFDVSGFESIFNVSGTGNLVATANVALSISGINTYSGKTMIIAGTVTAGSATALSPNSAFTVNSNSTLNLNGFDNTIGSLSGSGSVLNNGSTIATSTVGNDNTSTTFGGVLANGTGGLQLTKTGTGLTPTPAPPRSRLEG
jgi:hypothetical protein